MSFLSVSLFAPSDTAFAEVPALTLSEITADDATLTRVLSYHVLDGVYPSAQLTVGQQIPTLVAPLTLTVANIGVDDLLGCLGGTAGRAGEADEGVGPPVEDTGYAVHGATSA